MQATTVKWYSGQDTFEFGQGHLTKNQPITVLILLSESLAISQAEIYHFVYKKTLQLTSGSIGNSSTSTSSSCTVDKIEIFHFSHSFLSVNFTIQYISVSLPVTAKF